jgi:hypothetical protein
MQPGRSSGPFPGSPTVPRILSIQTREVMANGGSLGNLLAGCVGVEQESIERLAMACFVAVRIEHEEEGLGTI